MSKVSIWMRAISRPGPSSLLLLGLSPLVFFAILPAKSWGWALLLAACLAGGVPLGTWVERRFAVPVCIGTSCAGFAGLLLGLGIDAVVTILAGGELLLGTLAGAFAGPFAGSWPRIGARVKITSFPPTDDVSGSWSFEAERSDVLPSGLDWLRVVKRSLEAGYQSKFTSVRVLREDDQGLRLDCERPQLGTLRPRTDHLQVTYTALDRESWTFEEAASAGGFPLWTKRETILFRPRPLGTTIQVRGELWNHGLFRTVHAIEAEIRWLKKKSEREHGVSPSPREEMDLQMRPVGPA